MVSRLGPQHNFSFSLFIFVPRPAGPTLPQEEVFIMLEDALVPLILALGCVHSTFRYCLVLASNLPPPPPPPLPLGYCK